MRSNTDGKICIFMLKFRTQLVLVYLVISVQFTVEIAPQPKIAKNTINPLFRFQGRSRSSMLIPVKS